MATNDRCPRCGALVLPAEKFCTQCGAPLTGEGAQAGTNPPDAQPAYTGGTPRTIAELSAYCAFHGMPLEKMRFFVGVDYKKPRAFGIYQDGDRYVVYKNKDDGSRAVRYSGPDEAHAVGELYAKLMDECHKRGIWPEGRSEEDIKRERRSKRRFGLLAVGIVLFCMMITAVLMRVEIAKHAHDGYYRYNDAGIYYRYGNDWYYDDDDYDWVAVNGFPYEDYDEYYYGGDYEDTWGFSDFESSDAWESIQEERSSSSSSDYSGWDSGDTDWSSDW